MILYLLTSLLLSDARCTDIQTAINTDQCDSPEAACLLQSHVRRVKADKEIDQSSTDARRVQRTRCSQAPATDLQRLHFHKVVVSNLDGSGPNISTEQTLRYGNVWEEKHRSLDLVITALTPYTPFDATLNGIHYLPMNTIGQISVAAGTSVNLSFSLVDNKTGVPAVVPSVNVSVLKISTDADGSMAQSVTLYDYKAYHLNNETTLDIQKGTAGGMTFTATDSTSDKGRRWYRYMNEQEAAQAMDVEYVNVGTFHMTFSVGPGKTGAVFYVGGRSAPSQCREVPRGWGKPTCGVTAASVPLNEGGWRTVLTGHPLCRETDVEVFLRRVISAQGYCIVSDQMFHVFKRYFDGQCALHHGVDDPAYPKQNYAGLLKQLSEAVSKPSQCGGGWLRFGPPVGPACGASTLVQNMVRIPDLYEDGTGRLGEVAELGERGYRMVAMANSRKDMAIYIRRVMAKLKLRLMDEKALMGFVPHFTAACGIQSFDALVFELQVLGYALPCRCGASWLESEHDIRPVR